MPPTPDLSVIVPCFNEAENIPALVARTKAALETMGVAWEMILVDDGSQDRTRAKIEAAAAADPRVRGAFHEVNRGIVAGWVTGLEASRGRSVLPLDADLQYRPEDIPELWAAMTETAADLVQGWRIASPEHDPARRRYTAMFSGLLNMLFGMKLRDNKSGFILYRREAMQQVMAEREGFRLFQHFVAVAAHAHGFKIVEVPVAFDRRQAGASFITSVFRFALRAFADFPLALWKFRFAKKP
jgi:glycosyltransferase involved in cell wall biosynthesis